MSKICIECNGKNARKDRARGIYLCSTCSDTKKYKLICKTFIKNEYFITEDELEDYESYIVEQRRGYPDMTLYHLSDVLTVFCVKYNIDENNVNTKLIELKTIKERIKMDKLTKRNEKKKVMSEKGKINYVLN